MHRFTKRLLALLLALLMCLSLFPAAALAEGEGEPADEAVEETVPGSPDEPAEDETPNDPDTELDALPPAEDEIEESSSGTCGGDLTWTLDENGLLTISGTGEIMDYGPVPPPFYQIGSQVLSLQIDTGVTAIGDYFLYGCSGLSSVTIPGNITRIGSYAFANCSGMTELVLSEGLLRIGEKAFSNCSSLYSLSIPASAAEFGDYPFNGCSSLTEIHYGGTVSAWQQLDLAYDRMKVTVYCADGNVTPIDPSLCGDNLTWSLSGDGVLTISGTGDMWNWEPCNSPDTTTPFVPAWSTQREQIKSVVIEPGVTSIGAHAFDCCTALTAVTIPDTVTQIRGNAFNQCSSLTGISIPESVTVIDSAVFQLCHALTDIVIPDGVTEIRTAAFNGCTSLSSLTLPASLSSIGEKAFLQCVGLTEIRFCGHAPSFGSDVFSCYSSDSVITATAYYPSGDATWTDAVRQNYGGNITWVAYSADASAVASGECGDDLTWTLDENGLLTVSGTGDMWDYEGDYHLAPWFACRNDITSLQVVSGVTSIGAWAFAQCGNLTSASLPDSVTRIKEHAFCYCNQLKELRVPAGVTVLEPGTLYHCLFLERVYLPGGLQQIGEAAMGACPVLLDVYYDGSMAEWADCAANIVEGQEDSWVKLAAIHCTDGDIISDSQDCGANAAWTLENGVLTISGTGTTWDVYKGMWYSRRSEITSIVVEEGITGINRHNFYDLDQVTSVSLPQSLRSIKQGAFMYMSSLQNLELPAGLTELEHEVFLGAGLTTIKLPDGLTALPDRTFQDCENLRMVELPAGITSIGEGAFRRAEALEEIEIPAGVTTVYDRAFDGCTSLTDVWFLGDAPEFAGSNMIGTEVGTYTFRDVTATIHYPKENATWTDAVRQNYGGNITWVAYSADASVVASGECGDDLTWTLDENGLLTVSGTGDMWQRLGEGPAWYEHTGEIKAVLVGEDVTSIRFSAFYYCENLTTVTILSAAQIGDDAFSYCSKLRTVRYGGTVDTWKQFSTGCDRYAVTVFCSDGTIQPASSSQCGDDLTWSVESGTLTIRGVGPMWNYSGNNMPWASEQFTAIAVEEGVTSIGDCAFSSFQYSGSVTSLLLPDSLLSIGNSAFSGCSNLSDVIIPEGVTSIGGWAFSPAENARISVPVSVTSIGDRAFGNGRPLGIDYGGTISQWKALVGPQTVSPYYATVHCLDGVIPTADFSRCGDDLTWTLENGVLTVRGTGDMWPSPAWFADYSNITAIYSVVLEEGVTSVGEGAFGVLPNLRSLSLPSTLTRIDASAFNWCSQLQTVVFPAGLERIGQWAFQGCGLTELRFYGSAPELQTGALGLGQDAVIYYPAGDESWTEELRQQYSYATWIPFDARYLATGECGDDLTWTLDPDGLLTISGTGPMWEIDSAIMEPWARWRGKIISVKLESDVTDVKPEAFNSCFGIEQYMVDENNQSFATDDGILYSKDGSKLVLFPNSRRGHFTIPEGVVEIGSRAFYNAVKLDKLTVPAGMTAVGESAFAWCEALQSVVFTGPAPIISDNAFMDVTATVWYPAGDGSWNDVAGQSYSGRLTWQAGEPTVYSGPCGDNVTWTLDETGLLTISGVGEMWDYAGGQDNSPPWLKEHGSKVKAIRIENGVTYIGGGAFAVGWYYMNPTSIELPDTLERIGASAFCQSWPGALTLPDGLKEIGDYAFGLSAVSGDLRIPGSVERIGSNAFRNCLITGVTLEDGVLEIGDEAFALCYSLTEARVPSSVESMGKSVFFGCSSLATVYYSGTVAEWQALAPKAVEPHITRVVCSDGIIPLADKYQCGDDLTWSLNDGVLTISGTGEMWDFSSKYVQGRSVTTAPWGAEAANIRELQITEGVSSVGDYAFCGLRQLSSAVSLPPSVTSIGRFAFYESAVSRLTIPHGVTTIGNLALAGIPELRFEGPAPVIEGGFYNTTVYYPAWEPSWAEEIQKDIYYNVTWIAEGPIAIGDCGESLHWRLSDDGVLTIDGSGDMDDYARGEAPWYGYREQIVSLVLEEGVSSIGDYAFADLAVLSSVETEEDDPGVDPNLLCNTAALNSIETPESLRRIGEGAFAGCTALEELTIPAGVESIGEGAFRDCPALETITFEGSAPEGEGCLDGSSAKVVFPAEDPSWTEELQQSFGGDTLWWPSNVINMGELNTTCSWALTDDGVLTVSGSGAMSNLASGQDQPWLDNRDQITAVVVEEGVISVGKFAFISCASVVSVSLPESLTTLRQSCFNGCDSLEKIVIPARVTKLEYNAFGNCDALHEIHFTGNAPSFSSSSFTKVVANAYYPGDLESWTEEVRQNYGGTITWLPCMSVNEESVPDPIFRDYILQQFDSDGDGMLSEEERLAVTVIDLEGSGVASLEGIALFPNLEELNAGGDFETAGQLTEVDLSANTRLKSLNLGFNQDLGQLDVSMLPELESLMVGFCGLSELDLSGNPALRELWCDNNNLAALDLSANPNLEHLDCCGNEELYFLDIRPCPSLVADYKAGGRHISWMEEAMPEMYESILVYGGTGDEDYRLAVNTWTHIQYASFVLVSVSYYYSDTGFARGYSGGNLEGNDLTLTAEEKEGYSFLGWYLVTEKDETGLPVAYGELLCAEAAYTFVLSENISLVAVYEKESARTCTVSFDMQGHGTAPAAQTVNEGDCAAEPEAPTAEGWLFGGWYTDPDCTEPYAFTTPVTEDITLYAKWTPSGHLPGDINGDGKVNNKDVTRLQKYLKGDEVEVNEAALDMNGDGKVNNKDLTRLQKYLKGDEVEIF